MHFTVAAVLFKEAIGMHNAHNLETKRSSMEWQCFHCLTFSICFVVIKNDLTGSELREKHFTPTERISPENENIGFHSRTLALSLRIRALKDRYAVNKVELYRLVPGIMAFAGPLLLACWPIRTVL